MRLLYITPQRGSVGGREQLSALHERTLGDLLGEGLHIERLTPASLSGFGGIIGALRGRIDGVTRASEERVARLAREVDAVWLDGTNLGRLARAIKDAAPATPVITFAHNVETRFFLAALRRKPSLRAAGVLVANAGAERLAIRHSDTLVAINARDSGQFRRTFGRAADDVLPMAIADDPEPASEPIAHNDYLLFVGGGFFANRAGIAWFARHVASRAALPTVVVGRGLEDMRGSLDGPGIRLVGEVEFLAPWYAGAAAVIAPIFDGSGMKTKVAEALMHGKRVIGTPEAFTGYEAVADMAGPCCGTAAEFLDAIAAIASRPPPAFDPALRDAWRQHHSPDALRQGMAAILGVAA